MAGVKGRSGPPGNNNAGEAASIRGIIRKVMNNGGRERLERGIIALSEKAEEGDKPAIEFFRDSIDGKPAMAVEVSGNVGLTVTLSQDDADL